MESSSARQRRLSPARRVFLQDVLAGLSASPKRLPCKYFYDRRGSELFDRICLLDEYYPTRCELAIMERFAPEMGQQIGADVMLVEYGSGSSVKTRYLLDELPRAAAYVPVDISGNTCRKRPTSWRPIIRGLKSCPSARTLPNRSACRIPPAPPAT